VKAESDGVVDKKDRLEYDMAAFLERQVQVEGANRLTNLESNDNFGG